MQKIVVYVTGNKSKVATAQHYLSKKGITVAQERVSIDEIQSENIEEVALDKAKKAYKILQKPLLVNDAGWIIPALNGFPGPFMKYINDWFTAEDFLNLMKDKEDDTVILRDIYVFYDGNDSKTFSYNHKGKFLKEIKGEGRASDMVISLSESGESVAEEMMKTKDTENYNPFWDDFSKWLNDKQK